MHSIRATWTNGQIIPAEPVDWPEGSELVVAPVPTGAGKVGMTEAEWRDDPESIAAWVAAVAQIEPPIWADGEEEEYQRYRKAVRDFNVDAVRKQMETLPNGEAP